VSGIDAADVRKLVIACDAGMGSSVMLASQLKRELRKVPVTVEHHPIGAIPADTDLVLCHAGLAERARHSAPGAIVVGFRVFLGDPAVARVVAALRQGGRVDGTVGG
jgi:PTS system mannitol-specific IIB component